MRFIASLVHLVFAVILVKLFFPTLMAQVTVVLSSFMDLVNQVLNQATVTAA